MSPEYHFLQNSNITGDFLSDLESVIIDETQLIDQFDHLKSLPKLSKLFLENNSYARKLHSSLTSLLQMDNKEVDSALVTQIIILLYLRVNGGNGHSPYIRKPYHGVCYPAACSLEDIKTNNMLFSLLYFPEKPRIFSLPLFNYPGEENF